VNKRGDLDLVAAAEAVAPLLTKLADEAEQDRRLPAETVDALVAADLMRMGLPEAYGGPEADPLTLLTTIEVLARADGAAGWCAMIASSTATQAFFLEPPAAREIFGEPDTVTGGAFAPTGTGTVDGDRVTVTGRWQWGSGTQHCRWILGGTLCDDDTFRLCWFPVEEVTFHDTWHSVGLRGTGSLDYSVEGAVVPLQRTVQPLQTPAVLRRPLAAFPNFTLLASCVAAVSLGIGRRAIDELVALAEGKRPLFSSKTLAESAFTHIELARAESDLRAARSFLHDEVRRTWDVVSDGGRPDIPDRLGVRMAAANAAATATEVADRMYTLAGGSSVYTTNVLQRCLRDAHVPTQHLQVAPKLQETFGRLLLGQETDTSIL
jgi:alkylation response protein AidB-like acyl-CoA dehydrogenase